eukprot:scaffold2857_cov344-Pavlova_lutheri.AAC.12
MANIPMKVGARVLEIASLSWQRGSKVQWMMAFFNKERVERSTARGREHSSGTTCRGNTLLGKGGTQCNGTMPLVWALSLLVQAKNQHVVYHRTVKAFRRLPYSRHNGGAARTLLRERLVMKA